MKILTIFFSSINKYGIKILSLILVYEILNIHKLRLSDYLILNSVKKKLEPCVPSPYYCLSKINKNIRGKKYCFIDFGCGKGRAIEYFRKNKFLTKIIGIEINKKLKTKLTKLQNEKTTVYIKDASNKVLLNFLCNKYSNQNLILYFYHPFSEDIFNQIINKFLSKSRKEIKIIVLGEIFIKKNLIKKFKIKKKKIHNLLNIYKFN